LINPSWFCYGPVNDGCWNYYISYITDNLSGTIKYVLNGLNKEKSITGNKKISILPPFMSVDVYDPEDNAPNEKGERILNGNINEANGK